MVFYNAVFYVTFMFDIKSNVSKVNKKKKAKNKNKMYFNEIKVKVK